MPLLCLKSSPRHLEVRLRRSSFASRCPRTTGVAVAQLAFEVAPDPLFGWRGNRVAPSPCQESRQHRAKLDKEIPCHQQRARREHHIAGQSHPLPEQGRAVEGGAARIGEAMLEHGVELRPADGEEVEQDPENQSRIVEPEGRCTTHQRQ